MIDVPAELVTWQRKFNGEQGLAFIAALPGRGTEFLERWELRVDGPSMYGMCALVLPVVRADGSGAVLEVQHLDEESGGEPVALRVWGGDDAVRLLDCDDVTRTSTMLLEGLDSSWRLTYESDSRAVVLTIETMCTAAGGACG